MPNPLPLAREFPCWPPPLRGGGGVPAIRKKGSAFLYGPYLGVSGGLLCRNALLVGLSLPFPFVATVDVDGKVSDLVPDGVGVDTLGIDGMVRDLAADAGIVDTLVIDDVVDLGFDRIFSGGDVCWRLWEPGITNVTLWLTEAKFDARVLDRASAVGGGNLMLVKDGGLVSPGSDMCRLGSGGLLVELYQCFTAAARDGGGGSAGVTHWAAVNWSSNPSGGYPGLGFLGSVFFWVWAGSMFWGSWSRVSWALTICYFIFSDDGVEGDFSSSSPSAL
ncbi:hypothetical protein RchiOBHm_Chr3g0459241 [Rosa chinensis]|uniref:Uncharacterized protein n=1 Tax=Rosa chinensis TaxID=74649 RepID=A0A2P6R820_ROSCH|nr:hypothetical protein RchiOBHm_Chr3g0459241 [Rosa chinensis]